MVGGIVVMRFGENALKTIERVKQKLEALKAGLPEGVTIKTTYDRSGLIQRAVSNLQEKLIEESLMVALVIILFLLHLRSALVAIITLPIAILMAFIVMSLQGINANIMSLGGIAIAIGAMVDAAIIMVENAHKHLEQAPAKALTRRSHCRGGPGGRPDALLRPAGDHRLLHPGLHPGGPGRPAVQAAGLHQDLLHGRGGDPLHHPRAGADGLVDPRQDLRPSTPIRSTAC